MITCLVNAVEGITAFASVALKCCLDLNKSGMLTAGDSKCKGPEAEEGSEEREGIGCARGVVGRAVTGSQSLRETRWCKGMDTTMKDCIYPRFWVVFKLGVKRPDYIFQRLLAAVWRLEWGESKTESRNISLKNRMKRR